MNKGYVKQLMRRMGLDTDDVYVEHFMVLLSAQQKFQARNAVHKNLWRNGWRDSLAHIRHKAKRLLHEGSRVSVLDDAEDLINYVVFFILNVRAGREGTTEDL